MYKYRCKSCGAEYKKEEVQHMCLKCDASANYIKIPEKNDAKTQPSIHTR